MINIWFINSFISFTYERSLNSKIKTYNKRYSCISWIETKTNLYFKQIITMKTRTLEKQWVERKDWVLWKILPTAALLYTLSLPQPWFAMDLSGMDEEKVVTDVTPQIEDKKGDTIDLWTLARGTPIKSEEEWFGEPDEDEEKPEMEWWDGWKKEWSSWLEERRKWPKIWVSGFLQVWTSVVPDFAGVFSDKPSMLLCVDASDKKSWFWLSYIRLDDFHRDPDYPVSQASVFVPYRSKTFKDGKRTAWASVECTFIDQQPGSEEFMPVIVWSYDTKGGWIFEWKYFHGFRKWTDTDALRLWITKKIGDALRLTAQWWYQTDYDKKFFGRIIADVDLWWWFWAQVSWIMKDWKITPTAWVLYKF